MAPRPRPAAERFWEKVQITEGCWLWTAALNAYGYGVFRPTQAFQVKAHRYAYEQLVGEIPEGLHLDHLCRNTRCVNPAHLDPVTSRVNTLRGVGPSAHNAQKTHCIHGHPFDAANTYHVDGRRRCRACSAARQREYAARRRALPTTQQGVAA